MPCLLLFICIWPPVKATIIAIVAGAGAGAGASSATAALSRHMNSDSVLIRLIAI